MDAQIQQLILHKVGNKLNDEKVSYSKSLISIDLNMNILLNKYFFSTIRNSEYYNLYHESDLFLNEIYVYVSRIFDEHGNFLNDSKNIANHLYEKSEHPKIQGGDLFIVYFSNCQVDGKPVDAIGIFKSENKDTFIKVKGDVNGFQISLDSGANINKLDKGCIIYNVEKEKGYLVSIIDNLSKTGLEAQYWKDDFLHAKSRKDEFFHTKNIINLCKNFVREHLSENPGILKADQIEFLNETASFFKGNSNFEINEFSRQVCKGEDIHESFINYIKVYETEKEEKIAESFQISQDAVKKQTRSLKNIIKLDKNFRILVDGDRRMMKKGFDEELGLYYYTLYFKDEI